MFTGGWNKVTHNGKTWGSLVDNNVWKPGTIYIYKSGEYMIWTDGTVKKCIQDTNFSPDDWPQAWEDAE